MFNLLKSKNNNFLKIALIIINFFVLYFFKKKKNIFFSENEFVKFKYQNYQREMITEKMKYYSYWELWHEQPYFINGVIRKYRPKKCLEIGVASGGSSVLILNAIKDIKDSFLISLDLSTDLYCNKQYKTGYTVYKNFPELTQKWRLYTGEQPHKFLDELKLKFDFLLLDTVHFSPGEIINLIEVLPFLEENAIIVLHDIMYHLPSNNYTIPKSKKFHPSNIYLMTALYGDKVIIENEEKNVENVGAIHLYSNQNNYYFNYFLLLLSPWEYMPAEKHIQELRHFIKKYYKKNIYLNLFNKAVEENEIYVNRFKNFFKLYN